MKATCPFASFIIQHIGSVYDPFKGWALNCRKQDTMMDLLYSAKYKDVILYDDANYPFNGDMDESVKYDIERLPYKVFDIPEPSQVILPDEALLKRNDGYNWIAIAKK